MLLPTCRQQLRASRDNVKWAAGVLNSSRSFTRASSSFAPYQWLPWRRPSSVILGNSARVVCQPVASAARRYTLPQDPAKELVDELDGSSSSQSDTLRQTLKEHFILPQATDGIQHLTAADIGRTVTLHGYVRNKVDLSPTVSFITLIDQRTTKSIQVICRSASNGNVGPRILRKVRDLPNHSPVAVRGTVREKRRPIKRTNAQVANLPESVRHDTRHGDIEVLLHDVHVLNKFPSSIQFEADTVFSQEQRHLQLRRSKDLRRALVFRSIVASQCRYQLEKEHNFTAVETPILFKSTPEGAREFLVPTRRKGFAYALPQSPQQYKQILMASGISRYYQMARCFRDEDLRADRQPEFTQLDLEMAFATGRDVMAVVESLVRQLWIIDWKHDLDQELPAEPFQIMSYEAAMTRYGSDKPDLRLGMEIKKIGYMIPVDLVTKLGPLSDPIVEAFKFSVSQDAKETRQFVSEFMDLAEAQPFITNPNGQPGIFIFDPRKPLNGLQPFGFEAAEALEEDMGLEEGDLVVVQARQNASFSGGSTALGRLRLALHKAAVSRGFIDQPTGWRFLWINQFPLFSPTTSEDPGQGGSAGLSSTHHPFTAPASLEDIDLLLEDPAKVKADHYDLVLNGIELGGGSRRIHDPRLQEFILKEVLKMSEERLKDFDHLLNVLRSGCPPHAGFAFGFDRLIAVMLGKDSIRDVIAFPKTGSGEDPMVKSPRIMTDEQLSTYHLALRRDWLGR